MPDKIKFFSADYRDKFVYIKKNKFPIGSFVVDFLNQYEENDNGARIASMRYDNWILSSQMERGYINDYDFVRAGKEILDILDVLPNISPFQYLDIEAEKILALIKKDSYVITMEIGGKQLSSEDFSLKLEELNQSGISELVFVIGSSHGISKKVSERANYKLSLSKMTFLHQFTRLLLLEQIYRAFKISKNEIYHK